MEQSETRKCLDTRWAKKNFTSKIAHIFLKANVLKTDKVSACSWKAPLSFEMFLGQFKICVLSEGTVSEKRKFVHFSDHCLGFESIFRKVWKTLNFSFALQHRAARIIKNSTLYTSSRPLILQSWAGRPLKSSLAMSLKQWSSSRSMTWLHNTCVASSQKNSACSSRNLRNTETDLRLPKKKSANGQQCFSFRGAKIWNSLPAESKTASSLNSFKKLIKG